MHAAMRKLRVHIRGTTSGAHNAPTAAVQPRACSGLWVIGTQAAIGAMNMEGQRGYQESQLYQAGGRGSHINNKALRPALPLSRRATASRRTRGTSDHTRQLLPADLHEYSNPSPPILRRGWLCHPACTHPKAAGHLPKGAAQREISPRLYLFGPATSRQRLSAGHVRFKQRHLVLLVVPKTAAGVQLWELLVPPAAAAPASAELPPMCTIGAAAEGGGVRSSTSRQGHAPATRCAARHDGAAQCTASLLQQVGRLAGGHAKRSRHAQRQHRLAGHGQVGTTTAVASPSRSPFPAVVFAMLGLRLVDGALLGRLPTHTQTTQAARQRSSTGL